MNVTLRISADDEEAALRLLDALQLLIRALMSVVNYGTVEVKAIE